MNPTTLTAAATLSYAANTALGVSVATRLIDTSRMRWTHHALYIATFALTGAAVLTGVASRSRRGRHTGWILAPALVPLAAINTIGSRTRAHPVIALTAAPFFAGSSVVAAVTALHRRRNH